MLIETKRELGRNFERRPGLLLSSSFDFVAVLTIAFVAVFSTAEVRASALMPETQPAQSGADREEARAFSQAIDSLVAGRMSELNIPGYSLCVIKNSAVVHRNSYGFANVEMRQPVTPETVFGLASVTKTFTALTLLSLVDKGLIGLEDPLEKYLKGLSNLYKGLTIRQLASMTAGVPSQVPIQLPWRQQFPELMTLPLVSPPGSQFLYSNHSYRLLGSVIETVTGRPYLEVVSETVLQPLNMSMTGTPITLSGTGLVAQPYGDRNGTALRRPITYLSPEVSFAAGMLASNVDDLTRYVLGLMNGKIVSAQAYQILWYDRPPLTTGAPSHWAFGWGSKSSPIYGGKRVVSMNGGIPGVASTIIILPETNSAVIALCNLRKPPVYGIAQQVARLAFGVAQGGAAQDGTTVQGNVPPGGAIHGAIHGNVPPGGAASPQDEPVESPIDSAESESMQNE